MTFFDTGLGLSTLAGRLRWRGLRDGIADAVDRAMPEGALEEEFTEALLFVLSIRLNGMTGGAPGMTFSARCHISAQAARRQPVWAFWAGLGAVIDLYCAAFRGEVAHCRIAWENHRTRTRLQRRG